MRVRPKGHAQDARGQLRPKDRVAKPRVPLLTPTGFSYSDQLFTAFPDRPLSLLWGRIVGVLWSGKLQLLRRFAGWDKCGLWWSCEAEKADIILSAVRLTTGQRPKQ